MGADDVADGLAERLERLEAREQIRDLKHRYLRACDAKDVTAFRACFVDGPVELDYGPLGTFEDADTLAELFERFALRRGEGGYLILDMHHAVHASIRLEGPEQARGHWTLRFRQIDRDQRVETLAAIEYDDHYVRSGDDWRIRASVARQLWSMTRPLPADTHITETIDG